MSINVHKLLNVCLLTLISHQNFGSGTSCLLLRTAAYIRGYFRLDFIMEANNMNPDQTAPKEQSDLGS